MATRTANTGTNNWNTNAAWVGGVQPTAADDVVIPASAIVTIPAATTVLGRSLTVQASGTLAGAATTSILTLGDATAGAGNVAISISATATITNTAVWQINLISTSTTQQTISTGGKTLPNLAINGAGSSYVLASSLAMTAATTLSVLQGTFNTGNFAMNIGVFAYGNNLTRTVTLGSSAITLTNTNSVWSGSAATNLTVTANTAVATVTGNMANSNSIILININWNGLSFVFTGGGTPIISTNGGATINNLTYTGIANKTTTLNFSNSLTISGTLSIQGNSIINRVMVDAQTRGNTITLTVGTLGTMANVDLMDITAAGASSPWNLASITGGSGDAQGNSNITFTTAISQTYSAGTGTWSTMAWPTRVPLPQDNTLITGSGTITGDMPRNGRDIDFTGFTGTFSQGSNWEHYGSLTLVAAMTFTSASWGASGRGTHTLTWAGKNIGGVTFTLNGPGGSYTLQDAFNSSGQLQHLFGTFDTSSMSVTSLTYLSNTTNTRALTLGTTTWTLLQTTATTVWNLATSTGMTLSGANSTIIIGATSANTRTFSGGGLTYGTLTYTLAGSTGQLTIVGNNTFNGGINFSDSTNARSLVLTAGSIQTLGSSVSLNTIFGTSGKLMSILTTSAGSPAYISRPSGGPMASTADYISFKDIRIEQPLSCFVGSNCTDVSGNSGIYFGTTSQYKHSQSNAVTTAAVTSQSVSYLASTTAGNLLIAYVESGGSTGAVGGISGWTLAMSITNLFIYYKIADGSETTVSYSQTNSRQITMLIAEYSGFAGTPTLDVTDSNTGGSLITSLSTTSSTGPTNTSQPALALAAVGGVSTLAALSSVTNGFVPDWTSSILTSFMHNAVKELTTTTSVATTFTWLTSRSNVIAGLVVFRDVPLAGAGSFFPFF